MGLNRLEIGIPTRMKREKIVALQGIDSRCNKGKSRAKFN
jgi:hypothetical protein